MMESFSSGNNMDGYTYDADGNLLSDGTTTYTYDAENRVISATNSSSGTSTYVYNADGQRVRKTVAGVITDFLYDLNGNQVAAVNGSGTWIRGEVYAAGRHFATYSGGTSGTTYFNFADHLGTERARATVGGTVAETCTSLPFGDWLTCTGVDPSPMHFTGQEHDGETGLDHFPARYYGGSLGRFMSPDPTGIFLGNLNDPQSLNLYSYVRNNPLSLIDPLGLCTSGNDASGADVVCGDPIDGLPTWITFGYGLESENPNVYCQDHQTHICDLVESGGHGGNGGAGGRSGGGKPQTWASRLVCAENFGQSHSLAAGLGFFFGDKVENNFATQLLLGNTVSSIFKIGTDIAGVTTPTTGQLARMTLKGGAQGIPIPPDTGPIGARGVGGLVIGPVAAGVVNGITGASTQTLQLGLTSTVMDSTAMIATNTAAFYFGLGKIGFDGATFAIGYIRGCPR
jgi:RHS repeat-associated protein